LPKVFDGGSPRFHPCISPMTRRSIDSITNRLMLLLFVAVVLPLCGVVFTSQHFHVQSIRKSAYSKADEIAKEVERQIGIAMQYAEKDLLSLSTNPFLLDVAKTPAERRSEMDRQVEVYKLFTDITLFDQNGAIIESTSFEQPLLFERYEWFDRAQAGQSVISRPKLVPGQEGLQLSVYHPVDVAISEKPWVIKARVPFTRVTDLLSGVTIGRGGSVVLLDSQGNILAGRDAAMIYEKFDQRYDQAYWASHAETVYDDGQQEFVSVARVMRSANTKVDDDWTLVCLQPMSELNHEIQSARAYQSASGAVALLLSVTLGVVFSRRLGNPVIDLSVAAEEVVRGDLNVKILEKGPVEMKRMASSFNKMIEEVRDHRFRLEMLVDSRTKKLRRSQQELEDLSAQLQATYESTPEAILVVRRGGSILTANRQIKLFFNLDGDLAHLPASRFETRLIDSFRDADEVRERWEILAANPDAEFEGEWVLDKPVHRVVSVYSAPVRNRQGVIFARLWMFRDVTERKQLELGLQQAQKMEAIGRLAGGVAHDFNNLLTGILGNLNLAEMEGVNGGEAGECLLSAKMAGQRAAELVKQLLGFSRQTRLELQQRDVNGVLKEVYGILRHTLDPRVRLEQNLGERLWGAKIDVTQISQVVMNMCVNAKDAMPRGGTIRLGSRNVTVSESQVPGHVGARAGDFIVLSVDDDGEGMPPEVIEKIFEPFFTTKEQGKGTGLGLATSYGIVQQHKGWIVCESELGRGTRFEIYIPRDESGKRIEEESSAPQTKTVGGDETILLVDDEVVVRGVAAGVLKHHGYKILTASDGIEGLEVIAAHGGKIDLVLLDLTMPRLSGRDTFRRIREEFGDLPVVVCSGYLVDLDEFAVETGARPNGFVQKPYSVKDLAMCVRGALDVHAETHAVIGLNA
jgi:two-component system cell cycle sensor histidine kinase/response regulator CckA